MLIFLLISCISNFIGELALIYCSCLQYYRCILLIPDIYNKQHVKELVNMILMKMGFSGKIHNEANTR